MTYRELYIKYKTIALNNGLESTAIKILIQEISNFSNNELYLNYDQEIDKDTYNKIIFAIDKYINEYIPVQYILGYTYFYGLKFSVNKNVLIPRRETEELVDWIIKNNIFANPRILDIGTGSGAIAISTKKFLSNANVTACDISNGALEVAKKNAKDNDVEINFVNSNIFSNINAKFDIIVSNPPYIEKEEHVDELVLKNEPHLALFAEKQGLYFYEEILKNANKYIEDKSLLIFEIPEDKDEELEVIVKTHFPNAYFEIKKDMQGKSRILIIKNNWR